MQKSPLNTTSWAVRGLPSDQVMPSLKFHVMEVKSSATPPLATVGISSTSQGTMTPSGS